jgi:PAS domain S-box-containing protein
LLEGLGPVSPTFDDWLTIERERLAAEVIAGHRRLLDLYAAAGTPERAIAATSRLVEVDPFREEARRELMLLYAECGHTGAAIAQYEAYAALLKKELGAQPEQATQQVHRLLVDGQTPARARQRKPLPIDGKSSTPDGASCAPVSEFLNSSVVALEQMPDCVVVTDLEGRIVGWNQWAKRNFGYDKREVIGRKPFFLYGPGGGEDVTARLIDKAVRYGRWSGVLRLFNKDGSSRLHKRTMMPLRDVNGRVVGVFGVTRPLTRPIPGL